MKWFFLVLCMIVGCCLAPLCNAADFTLSPAPEAPDVVEFTPLVPAAETVQCTTAACTTAACTAVVTRDMRRGRLVRGQPVRNVGRVLAAPFRAIAKAKPLRRLGAVIRERRPVRRFFGRVFSAPFRCCR